MVIMGTQRPCWLPVLAMPNIITIAEECECVCNEEGPCCCHGDPDKNLSDYVVEGSSDHTGCLSPLEEFDGIDDILAVSHVTDKPSVKKKKPPLLRAKTLPAIITPSLNIIQAQLEVNNVLNPLQDGCRQFKPSSVRSKPHKSPSGSGVEGDRLKPIETEKFQLQVEDESFASISPGTSPRHSVSSNGSNSSHVSSKECNKQSRCDQGTPSSRAGLSKLARLLTHKEKSNTEKNSHLNHNNAFGSEAGAAIRKANSIDSLLDSSSIMCTFDMCPQSESMTTAPADTPGSSSVLSVPKIVKPLPSSPSVPAKLESHKRGNIPTSPSVPSKLAKGVPVLRQGSSEVVSDVASVKKAEKKRQEKINKINIDLQAVFAAVEYQHVERARAILETTDVDVNSVNADGFSLLDIAVMTNNVTMVKHLQSYGGTESSTFSSQESRTAHLKQLVQETERCVEDLTTCVLSAATSGSLSVALLKEKERQLALWQRRHKLLKRMKTGFDRIRPPDPPTSVQLEVVGTRSLKVRFVEPETANEAESIVTRYKVEWSSYEDFNPLAGSQEIPDLQKLEVTIPDLTQGTTYFVRVAAGNAKGYSDFQCTSPLSATPSCWRDVDGKKPRAAGRLGKLDDLFNQLVNSRPARASEVKGLSEMTDTPQQQRRQMRKSIKQLFTSAPKFQKTLKRGVYLACLLYNEDKVLVTPEDMLPILDVDETYPSSLHTDFHWLMKVACTWEDVKSLRQDMEKSHSFSTVHFRSKLLQAVEQMQAALGVQDLGQLFYKPLKDTEGTIVLCTSKFIPDPKSLPTLSVRWLPLSKIQRKRFSSGDNCELQTASDILLDSLQEMISYNQVSTFTLPRGLYIGYLKLQSSVDLIRVLTPVQTPNILPHCRIRENPHISCEEWEWLKSLQANTQNSKTPTDIQVKFQKTLSSASRLLLSMLGISEQINSHRIYDAEVIELSEDVSFILLLPPVESVCAVPGHIDELTSREDCILLPVQIFEMIHMTTYQPSFIARYSRLSSILEMDTMVAQHAQREAFSDSEIASAKSRVGQLQDFQSNLDDTWRAMRWIMDVLTFARDKQTQGGIPVESIWLQENGSPSPEPSPQNSPVQQKASTPGRAPKSEPDNNFLRINNACTADSKNPNGHLEIRRSASTSRLLVNTSHDDSDSDEISTACSKAQSAEKLSSNLQTSPKDDETNQENSLDIKKDYNTKQSDASPNRDSVRSSFTGSFKSVSSHEIEESKEEEESLEKISIYSKDSACSVGEGVLCKKNEDIDEGLFQELTRPSSSNSNSSGNSISGECQSGIIRVYAAYDTGLPSGTSVKLHVTPQTTAREVVDLVVKQLNMAVILKGRGGPIYGNTQLQNFCLVAVVGMRERCLSDDFQPLMLQNPWTKGKFFIRMKDNTLHSQQNEDCK